MPPEDNKLLENIKFFVKDKEGKFIEINKEPIKAEVQIKRDSVK
jgi:hypothetical protein